jgi:dTDP-L-rhamnose 4-epimerase
MVIARIEEIAACMNSIQGCEAVVHLAAGVSVSASYNQPARFVQANSLGTAVLWEAVKASPKVRHFLYASSMAIYGDGLYEAGIAETWPQNPRSIYGLSKGEAERITTICGDLYGVRTTSLRLWNVYGPGQSLNNSETGAAAIFASRILTGESPRVYEDGKQLRDFIYVDDVARCFAFMLERGIAGIYNVGTGHPTSVLDLANRLCSLLSAGSVVPHITREYRPGDVRNCWPNLDAIHSRGWKSETDLDYGLQLYASHLRSPA